MKHSDIDKLVNNFTVDTARGPVDKRVQQVVVRLVGDLFTALPELEKAL